MKRKPLSFEDRLFAIVRNLLEYGNYGKNIDNAAKKLYFYHPETTLEVCQNHINQTVEVYQKTIYFVEQNKEYYWKKYEKGNYFQSNSVSEKEAEFIKKHDKVSESLIKSIIGWIFFWRHLK